MPTFSNCLGKLFFANSSKISRENARKKSRLWRGKMIVSRICGTNPKKYTQSREGRRAISDQEEAKVLIYYKNHKICIPNSWYFFLKYLFLGMNFSSYIFVSSFWPLKRLSSSRILSSFLLLALKSREIYLRNDILWTGERKKKMCKRSMGRKNGRFWVEI